MAGGGGGGEEGDFGFQIAPMVDVVFVLMLFFMACAGQQIVEKELGINLPSGQANPGAVPKTPIIVEIDKEGQVRVQGEAKDTPGDKQLPVLRAWLKDKIERFGGDDPVILRPANETKHERIMDVLNAAAAVGVKNLTFS
jgi:biopolymer transport protein ExbD